MTLAQAKTVVAVGEPKLGTAFRASRIASAGMTGASVCCCKAILKGAEYAFRRVTEIEPAYPDGWVNVARVLIQEGETDAARPFAEKALELSPKLARAHFFRVMIQKADGDYDGALKSLARNAAAVSARSRRAESDRAHSVPSAPLQGSGPCVRTALTVDSEDLQAHYNLMLCYRGLGQTDKAEREETLFRRFKADEASQQLTARPDS